MTEPANTEPTPVNPALAQIVGLSDGVGILGLSDVEEAREAYNVLVRREDEVKDQLRMHAASNGLALPVVNHVLEMVGLGTPMTRLEHEHTHQLVHNLAEEVARQQQGMTLVVTDHFQVALPDEVLQHLRTYYQGGGT